MKCRDCRTKIYKTSIRCRSCARKGELNPNWKRGYSIRQDGYAVDHKTKRLFHRVIWEKHYGKIPKGFCIHHKNHNKLNNSLSNLELIHITEHNSKHLKSYKNSQRKCSACELIKPINEFPKRADNRGYRGRCKPCFNKKQAEYMKVYRRNKIWKIWNYLIRNQYKYA